MGSRRWGGSPGGAPTPALQPNRREQVLARIREVPEGFVRAYGDVSPGAPRFAGTVLHSTREDVPWWRIVRADGSLAKGDRQRALLEAEGVPFRGEKVDMRAARIP
jgi:methylated-DNA-protein-cysteine methyltransferase-like protein